MSAGNQAGGLAVARVVGLSTTGVVAKASQGQVFGWYLSNSDTIGSFVKLYDKATQPINTDVPILTINVPASGAANISGPDGIDFLTGISMRATVGVADNDTVATSSSTTIANILYR